jgi:hypothetical protein
MHRYALAAAALSALVAAASVAAAPAGSSGRLVFSSNRSGQQEIYTANPDGSGRVELGAQGNSPQWSPDGSRIAFSSNRDGNSEIYVMNADGSGQTRLTFNTDYDSRPQWTADGSQLVFTRIVDGNWEIFRMNADGTNQVDLTNNPAVDWGQATSPQGKKVVFTREENGIGHLFVMSTDGKNVQRLTNTGAYDSYPSWSPKGNQILFTRDPGELWVMASDGTGQHQVTSVGPARVVLNGSWSPDATQIVYTTCAANTFDNCILNTANADGSGATDVSTPRAPYLDTFTGSRLDPFWGGPFVTGGGVSIAQTNGELEVSVPSAATVDPSFGFISLGVNAQCRLVGDFDVQVDYRLLSWAEPSDVNLDFDTAAPDFSDVHGMFVFDPGFGTGISTHFSGPSNAFVFDSDTSGTLRLRRVGSTVTAYSLGSAGWVPILTAPDSTADQAVNLNVFSNAPQFSHPDIKVAYDNFRLASGTFGCPSWWSDSNADWQLMR